MTGKMDCPHLQEESRFAAGNYRGVHLTGQRDFWKNSDTKEFIRSWSIWRGPGCSEEPLRWSWRVNDRTRCETWCSRAPCFATLWNLFYEDAWRAIQEAGFVEFEHSVSVDSVMTEAKKCQTELHKWGKANRVSFDPAKESVHTVSHAQPHDDPSKLLGITFDCKLRMDLCVRETVNQASWKLTTILRTRRFHEVARLVQVHKSKILSFVEYRTPAVCHAASTILAGIDAVQRRFLRVCCLTQEDALMFFNLAPLETRRDMAMLGLIHRKVLGCGPRHFASMFRLAPPSSSQKHCWQRTVAPEILRNWSGPHWVS